jgi:two-component system sensor histidine kinase RegB
VHQLFSHSRSETDPALARPWLVRLRWGAMAGQLVTVLFAAFSLDYPLPLFPIVLLIGTTAASNLLLARSRRPEALPLALLLDLGVLTGILALAGGASNPFSVLYLVHVVLAAVLLGPRWTWRVAVVAIAGFGLLFLFTDPHEMHRGEGMVRAHLSGMWAAFAVTGATIAWFVARLARAVGEREAEIARLRRHAERQERVVALATLAAGAAHELGSPLAAIAVSARELAALSEGADPALGEEARAVRAQVERCRAIVARLTQRAGAAQAEVPLRHTLAAAWGDARARLPGPQAERVILRSAPEELAFDVPPDTFGEVLASLVRNALQAGEGPIHVEARAAAGGVEISVQDRGRGMSAEELERAGEPFFTTRAAGDGMGLGLFLCRRFAESMGGGMTLQTSPGAGTRVTLFLPGRPT